MNERLTATTIGEIVATDVRTAGVFEQFGIDFCCGGRRCLADACRSASADPSVVIRALDALPPSQDVGDDVTLWPIGKLIDHIVSCHHAYIRTTVPTITRYLSKLAVVHGERHPELASVRMYFERMAADLSQHMVKEEHVLFPYLRELARDQTSSGRMASPFGTVRNPIDMMEREHREAADSLRRIRELTQGFTAPADGCTTYAVCMAELAAFERNLHEHVHLENNVLFPRALQLERNDHV
jgi:regulator of cell morphogenesis and NO signaling